ncbi:hypothetical protein U0070_021546 [Myodes glareolus]|uniref:Uncharacterized protein n=1 Tax=Myodes glareolus TaxID=447135 RepID=A0AAW0IDS0_MYOGA
MRLRIGPCWPSGPTTAKKKTTDAWLSATPAAQFNPRFAAPEPYSTHTPSPVVLHRVALVTGATKASASQSRVTLSEVSQGTWCSPPGTRQGAGAVQQLQAEGLSPRFHQLDIDDLQSIRALRDFLLKEYGGLDVLVNMQASPSRMLTQPLHIQQKALKNCSPELQQKFRSDTITEESWWGS